MRTAGVRSGSTFGAKARRVVGESPDAVLLSTEAHPTRGEFVAIDLSDLLLLSPDEQVGRWREHRPEISVSPQALQTSPPSLAVDDLAGCLAEYRWREGFVSR